MLTKNDVLSTIKTNMNLVMEAFDETGFDPIKSMRDHGANSLEMIEIVSRTMRQLGVKVPRVRLNRVNNIDELANEFVLVQELKGELSAVSFQLSAKDKDSTQRR